MSKKSGAGLFKEPAKWPLLPPWWLLSAPQVAALLNVTSATLHNWRIRGEGPDAVPPMYLKPTQGDPVYYRYGDVRTWAASRIGLNYPFEEQCRDFFAEVFPQLNGGTGSTAGRAKVFDRLYRDERHRILSGTKPLYLDRPMVEALDLHYSRQPRRTA